MTKPLPMVMLSWERPLYLWASLDSVHRSVRGEVEIHLIDNGSRDPLVREVIAGFERRGLFASVTLGTENDPDVLKRFVPRLLEETRAPYLVYLETDVTVPGGRPSWVARMAAIMQAHPRLGILGSQVDRSDFADVDEVVARFRLERSPEMLSLLKAHSPERVLDLGPDDLADPHNPPGRLLMLRTEALRRVGMAADAQLYRLMQAAGWDSAITGAVVHRHLSFQNVFDYPDYDMLGRDRFIKATHQHEDP